MFPAAMFATGDDGAGTAEHPTSVSTSSNGISLTKYVSGNQNDGYKLTMEAYASNIQTTTTTTSTTPLDIVLVLDVSASMNNDSKLDALQTAAKSFVNTVCPAGTKNRVALVKFAQDEYADEIGNHGINNNTSNYEATQVVWDFDDNAETLGQKIDALHAGGQTAADYGLTLAGNVLSGQKPDGFTDELKGARDGAKKVVVFFTDGEPNHNAGSLGSQFELDVAEDAIAAAQSLKASGAEIYSVGVFDNDVDERIDSYMTDVASDPDSDHYFNVNSNELNGIFENIATSITTTNSLQSNPDADAELSDALSEYFNFPEDASAEATVQYASVEDYNPTTKTFTFGEPGNLSEDIDKPSVNISDKTITVTGFDYKAHAATYNEAICIQPMIKQSWSINQPILRQAMMVSQN